MDPKTVREQAIKDTKCGLILDAASGVFAQKGYWETRLEDIAAAAGFSKPSLYNYYPDKESIFVSLSIREFQNVIDEINLVAQSPEPFILVLEKMIRMLFNHTREKITIFMHATNFQTINAIHSDIGKHKELMGHFWKTMKKIPESFQVLIQKAQSSGEISSTMDPVLLARFVASLVRGVHSDWTMKGKVGDIDAAAANIIDFVKNGIGVVRR